MVLTILEFLSNACILFTIAVFSTGIPQCWVMIKQKDTENIPFLPYIMTCVNNAIWIVYSMLINNWTVYIVNVIGVILQITYICIYLFYSRFKAKESQMIVAAAACISLVIVYAYFTGNSTFTTNLIGILCNIVTILMFSSPLAELRTAIREKSTKTISFPLTVATFFCTLSWTVYGMLIKDMYLIIPNGLGLLTSFPRFYVFGRFRGSSYEHVHTAI